MLNYNFQTGMNGMPDYSRISVDITEKSAQDVVILRKLCRVLEKMLNRTEDYISYLTSVKPHDLDEGEYDNKSDRLFATGRDDL